MTGEHSYRSLPSVDRLLSHPRLAAAVRQYSREAVTDVVRESLSQARLRIQQGAPAPAMDELLTRIEASTTALYQPGLRAVINATGVVIHTNLGRSPLSADALAAVRQVAEGYSNLEFDLESGERGSRQTHVEGLVRRLTGAEAAMAVNNNASAMLLGLMGLTQGKEVIISRGEAVEIGGGFRIPDVLLQSGARLVEVGTTNRTYIRDFEQAITDNTGAFLRVHTSNFIVSGFTHMPSLAEMVECGNRRRVPVLHDIGSGCFLDSRMFGLAHEPTPQESIQAGIDLAFFSGDKLLGGPQSGMIIGKRRYVDILKQHPLARAVRLDKMTLAGLVATLLHYVKGEAQEKIPIWQMIAAPLPSLDKRARRWARAIGGGARVVDGISTIGGGSLPGEVLPSRVLAIPGSGQRLLDLARRLREGAPPVVARIDQGLLLLDPRTVLPSEEKALLSALARTLAA